MKKIIKQNIQNRIRKWIQKLDISEEAKKDYHFEYASEDSKNDKFKFCIHGEIVYSLYYGDKGKFDDIFEDVNWNYSYYEMSEEIEIFKEFEIDDTEKKERILKGKLRMFAEEVRKDLNDCINQYHEVKHCDSKLRLKTKLKKMMNFHTQKIDKIFGKK